MSALKSFIKNTLVYGIAAVLPKAISVLLVGLHTKTLANTAQFNVNTEFYVWAAYFNVLLTFGMETTFFKFFNSEKNKNNVLSTSFYTVTALTTIILSLLFVNASFLSNYLGFNEVIHFKTLIGILWFDTLAVIPFAYLRVNNKAFHYAILRIINICIYGLLNVFLLLWLKDDTIIQNWYPTDSKVGYIFLANVMASLLTFLMLIPILKGFKPKIDFRLLKKMLGYGWPILVAGLAYVTNENLDKLILPQFLNDSIAGAYAGSYKLGVFMSLFIMAFKLGAEPFFFNVAKDDNAQIKYALILKWFSYLGAFIVLFIIAYLDFFAQLLLKKPSYLTALNIVPFILIANLFLGIYNNLSVWYKVTSKTRYGMYLSILGAIITVIGLFVLVPKFGYISAAWVTVLAYGSMMFASYYLGQKHYPVPYDMTKIGFIFILMCLFAFLSFQYFRTQWIINSIFIIMFLSSIVISEYQFIQKTFLKPKR